MTHFLSYDLVSVFARNRNSIINFPFLKENGELLCIARAQGFLIEPRALNFYKEFYSKSNHLMELYPQYYRFLLGMVLDLEDLGMTGNMGKKIAYTVRSKKLVDFDTSDVRRLEALYLLNRVSKLTEEETIIKQGIENRLYEFTQNTERFHKFNRPLFYDLTHLVFFVTNYGKKKAIGFPNLKDCLFSVGFLSLLDNDIDLLSEVIICLKYIGITPPEYWRMYVLESRKNIQISYDKDVVSALNNTIDDYHVYLVHNWCLSNLGELVFTEKFETQTPYFKYTYQQTSLLSKLSYFAHMNVMEGKIVFNVVEEFKNKISEMECLELEQIINSTSISYNCLAGLTNEITLIAA